MRKEILSLLKNKVVVFDFDGVLAQFQSKANKVMMPQSEYIEACADKDALKYSRAPRTMIDYIGELAPENVYVLSQASSTFEQQRKQEFLFMYYPSIKSCNQIYVADSNDKLAMLRIIMKQENIDESQIVLIEDSLGVITSVESGSEITCVHISSMID